MEPGGWARWSMHATGFAAPRGAGGRGSASPLHAVVARHRCNLCVRWWRIPPRLVGVRRCLTRPAREGRGMTPSPGYGSRSRRGWAPAVRPGLQPRAESASPLKGAARGRHPAQRAEADSPPRGAVRQSAEAGSGNDPGSFRPARSTTPGGSRERGREDDDAAAARRTDPRRPICAVPFAAPPRCGTQRGASPLQGGRIFPAATPDPPAR